MGICKVCGGAIFAQGEVLSYTGAVCASPNEHLRVGYSDKEILDKLDKIIQLLSVKPSKKEQ